jgi:hypothetical protein
VPSCYRVYLWAGPIVLLNWLLVAFVQLNSSSSPVDSIIRQSLTGTLFGVTTVAAAWTAFGPARFLWRLPLSLVLVTSQAGAIAINGSLYGAPEGEFFVVGLVLLSQWLLLQFPLWGIAIGFGVHLVHASESDVNPSQRQFGIRQLMIVTAIVGVLFGIGRAILPYLIGTVDFFQEIVPVLTFLIFAEVVLTLPVVVAVLLRRHMMPGIAIALGLFGIGTACEVPLMQIVAAGNGPNSSDVVGFNVGTLGVMLIHLLIVRFNGYSLTRLRPADGNAATS